MSNRIFLYILLLVNSLIPQPDAQGVNMVDLTDARSLRRFGYFRKSQKVLVLGALLPNERFAVRQYASAVSNPLKEHFNMNRGYSLRRRYFLAGTWVFVTNYSPKTLINYLCKEMVAKNVSTIMYLPEADLKRSKLNRYNQYFISLVKFTRLPAIAYNVDGAQISNQKEDKSLMLQLSPSIDQQLQAILAILKRYSWKHFGIVTSSMAGSDNFISTCRKNIEDQTEFSSEASVIFERASRLGLTEEEYVWIVTRVVIDHTRFSVPLSFPIGVLGVYFDLTTSDYQNAIRSGSYVWGKGLENFVKSTQNSIVPSISCDNIEATKWKGGDELYEAMKQIKFKMTIRKQEKPVSFKDDGTLNDTLLDIVNLGRRRQWKKIGTWQPGVGLELTDITWPGLAHVHPPGKPSKYRFKIVTLKEDPYIIYNDLDPETGTCRSGSVPCQVGPDKESTFETPPVVYSREETDNTTRHFKCCSGFCIDLLGMLGKRIHFDYEMFEVADKKWGGKDVNGEWNGLVRSLIDGEADLCMTSLKITPLRANVTDFSVPYLQTGITILVAKRDGAISATAFLEPFHPYVWMIICLVCISASAFTLFFLEWLSPIGFNMKRRMIEKEPYAAAVWLGILVFAVHIAGAAVFFSEHLNTYTMRKYALANQKIDYRFSLFRSFWLTWAILFGAAVNVDTLRGLSSRLMSLFWALFALVFSASYTANLAAFMITKDTYHELTGLGHFKLRDAAAQKPPFRFATIPHGSTEALIKGYNSTMYEYMQQYNKTTVSEGVEALRKGDLDAFIYDATVLEFREGKDADCKLKTVGNWFAMTGYGIAFPRGSKWRALFNKHLLDLQKQGELERLRHFWLSGACKTKRSKRERSYPLAIANFTSTFLLLAGGMVLGACLLLLEHCYFKFGRRVLRQMDRKGLCSLISLSMGASLSFEETVRDAVKIVRTHQCNDIICSNRISTLQDKLNRSEKVIKNLQCAVRELSLLSRQNHRGRERSIDYGQPNYTKKTLPVRYQNRIPNRENPEKFKFDSVDIERYPPRNSFSQDQYQDREELNEEIFDGRITPPTGGMKPGGSCGVTRRKLSSRISSLPAVPKAGSTETVV